MLSPLQLRALAHVTLIEAWRQRLWLVVALAAGGLVLAAPNLAAIDQSAKLKLAVVALGAVTGFVVVLLALLVGAGQLRRDLDSRFAITLFSKPIGRLAYVFGRWLGVLVGLFAATVVLATAGTAVIAWQFHGLPAIRSTVAPAQWQALSALGEVTPTPEEARRKYLSANGAPGNGSRWVFTGLPTGRDLELLVKVRITGPDVMDQTRACMVELTAWAGTAGGPRHLDLAADSPYGGAPHNRELPPGRLFLIDRDESHRDLSVDYCRLRLPSSSVSPSGVSTVQLVRLEQSPILLLSADSALIARDGGSYVLNLVRGGLISLAAAGLLVAFTLLLSAASNLGVTLLGGLTLYFAGNALWTVDDTLSHEHPSQAIARLLSLAKLALPDFDRFTVSTQIAAGHVIGWDEVGAAWGYYGLYTVLFLGVAWLALARKEL